MFLNIKIFDDYKKKFIYMIDFMSEIEILLLIMLNLLKIPDFLFKIPVFC